VSITLVEPRLVGFSSGQIEGSRMFSSAFSVGTRLYAWNTKPTLSRRSNVRRFSSRPREIDIADERLTARELVEAGYAMHQRRFCLSPTAP